MALVARMNAELQTEHEGRTSGLFVGIDVTKPPKILLDTMSREDRQELAEAYDNDYQCCLKHETLTMVPP